MYVYTTALSCATYPKFSLRKPPPRWSIFKARLPTAKRAPALNGFRFYCCNNFVRSYIIFHVIYIGPRKGGVFSNGMLFGICVSYGISTHGTWWTYTSMYYNNSSHHTLSSMGSYHRYIGCRKAVLKRSTHGSDGRKMAVNLIIDDKKSAPPHCCSTAVLSLQEQLFIVCVVCFFLFVCSPFSRWLPGELWRRHGHRPWRSNLLLRRGQRLRQQQQQQQRGAGGDNGSTCSSVKDDLLFSWFCVCVGWLISKHCSVYLRLRFLLFFVCVCWVSEFESSAVLAMLFFFFFPCSWMRWAKSRLEQTLIYRLCSG